MSRNEDAVWVLAAVASACWLLSAWRGTVKNNDDEPFGMKELFAVVLMAVACVFTIWLTRGMK